jgi:hypothetical protein
VPRRNENELYAALVKNNIDPKSKDDVTIVNQPFDMNLFLNKDVDAAAAMTYNELRRCWRPRTRHGEPHARRPERDLDGGRRHGDARGRTSPGQVDRRRGEPGHRRGS